MHGHGERRATEAHDEVTRVMRRVRELNRKHRWVCPPEVLRVIADRLRGDGDEK